MNPVEAVLDATDRYLESLEAITDEQLREPSALPGWTRGHVLAHVGNHAHGMAGALRAARTGAGPVPVYPSVEARDAEIEDRAGGTATELAAHNQMGALRLAGELRLMKVGVEIERIPGGPVFTAPDVVEARWREVEIHRADLLLDYSPADWPEPFAAYLFGIVVAERGATTDLTLHVQDRPTTQLLGKGGHGVAGTRADLTWWLIGRGDGEGLTSTRPLPTLGPWR